VTTARVRRRLPAPPGEVWRLVGDPHQLPRWWPRAVRVEGVSGRGFTLVLRSRHGREVRADQRVLASDRPSRRAWALEVAGTPFERVFAAHEVEVRLAAEDDGTRIELEQRMGLRGASRLGAPLAWRSARRQLRAALDAVAEELEAGR